MYATTEVMLEDLRKLEANYWDQPSFAQRHDLHAINMIRKDLGMPLVDSMLRETDEKGQPLRKKVATRKDHTKAQEIYATYQKKLEELKPHREYAIAVERSTGNGSMTNVEPMATMGCNSGALLCDHCGKPMILEGGAFNRVPVDVAWAKCHPTQRINWKSYISGGMVIENVNNGTVRVYHGHLGGLIDECSTKGKLERDRLEAQHSNAGIRNNCKIVTEFVNDTFPDMTRDDRARLVNDILNTVFGFDPGIGINRPDTTS